VRAVYKPLVRYLRLENRRMKGRGMVAMLVETASAAVAISFEVSRWLHMF